MKRTLWVAAVLAATAVAQDGQRYQAEGWSVALGKHWTVIDKTNGAAARAAIASVKTGGRNADDRFVDSLLERAGDRIGAGLARFFVYMPDAEAQPLTLNVWAYPQGVRASELKKQANVDKLRDELGRQLNPPGTSVQGTITSQGWRKVDGYDALHLQAEQTMPGLAMKLEYVFVPLPAALLCVEASYSATESRAARAGMDEWFGSFDGAGQPSWFGGGGILGGALRGALIGAAIGIVLALLKKLKA